jgi:hypothetical protein
MPEQLETNRETDNLMEEIKFKNLLSERGIVIVHFSHLASMAHPVAFPTDLRHAIESYRDETRSCCALWPGHHMDLPGSVGVIFDPAFAHVVSVLGNDSGSSDYGGSENSAGCPPSEGAILDSLAVPFGGYNEWRVRGAEPIGIFVANPHDVCVKQSIPINVCGQLHNEIACIGVPLSVVVDAFPSLPIYTMGKHGLINIAAGDDN